MFLNKSSLKGNISINQKLMYMVYQFLSDCLVKCLKHNLRWMFEAFSNHLSLFSCIPLQQPLALQLVQSWVLTTAEMLSQENSFFLRAPKFCPSYSLNACHSSVILKSYWQTIEEPECDCSALSSFSGSKVICPRCSFKHWWTVPSLSLQSLLSMQWRCCFLKLPC